MATRPFRKPHSTLTPRQDAFASEYLADLNASAAARRAGFSAKTAGRQAIALLTKPHILARIQQLQAERLKRTEVNADWVLKRLLAELEANVQDLYDDSGVLKHPQDWPEVWQKGLVTSIRTTELYERDSTGRNVVVGQMKDITLADRVKRLELMGKHVSIATFRERIQVGVESRFSGFTRRSAANRYYQPAKCRPLSTSPSPKRRATHDLQPHAAHAMPRANTRGMHDADRSLA